jgi:hypothetical protein
MGIADNFRRRSTDFDAYLIGKVGIAKRRLVKMGIAAKEDLWF